MLQEFPKSLQHELCNNSAISKILATLTLQHFANFSDFLQHFFATIINVAKTFLSYQFGKLVGVLHNQDPNKI